MKKLSVFLAFCVGNLGPILTHWGRVTHICVRKLTLIGSDNGVSPGRHQAIIWTNAGILLIGPLGTNFSENLIGIQTFSFNSRKCPWKCRLRNGVHFVSASMCWYNNCVFKYTVSLYRNMIGSPIVKIRWYYNCFICIIWTPIPRRQHIYIQTVPWSWGWIIKFHIFYVIFLFFKINNNCPSSLPR